MHGLYYYIRSALNPDLVLTLSDNDFTTVVTSWLNMEQPGVNIYQQWIITGSDPNLTITNRGNGLQLKAASDDQGAALSVVKQGDTWSVSDGSLASTAIRPSWDFDLNVSCQGGSLENANASILWSWGGDNTDKTWTMQDVTTVKPYPTRQILIQPGGPSRTLRDDNGTIKANGPGNASASNAIWIATCWSTGISFKNKATGQYIAYGSDDSALAAGVYDMGVRTLWTTAPNSTGKDPRPWIAIRPYLNSNMNLNSFGGTDPNDTIGVWSWGGGDSNEIWLMHNTDNSSWAGC
jgi:hypothetical protein